MSRHLNVFCDGIREQRSQLLKWLLKVDPINQSNVLNPILRFLFNVDVTAYRHVIDWLTPTWGNQEAYDLVEATLYDIAEDYPLKFAISEDGRPCISCYVQGDAENGNPPDILGLCAVQVPYLLANRPHRSEEDDEDDQEEEEEEPQEMYTTLGGTVPAAIYVGR